MSWIFQAAIFLARVHLFLQQDDSADQLVGGHANTSQVEIFYLIDTAG
jgi:hypothetical protein